VINSIKVSVKVKQFSETTLESSQTLYDSLVSVMQQNITTLQSQIDALELLLLDLNEALDQSAFEEAYQTAQELLNQINLDSSTDVVQTIAKIKIKIMIKVVTKVDITINVDDERVTTQSDEPRTITLPQPSLADMPAEFATPITVTF